MIVAVCLDVSGGMMFHGRRQSRDRAVADRLTQICAGKKLWMNLYSKGLYGSLCGMEIAADPAYLERAKAGEYCLVESDRLAPYLEKIEKLIVFWWNRKYPSDVWLDLDLAEWEIIERREFCGSSHDKITEEVYRGGGLCR